MSRITVKISDMFQSNAQTLVNTVNCVGIMGKGIALEFKKRFPDMFREYERLCKEGQVQLGQPYLYKQLVGPWVLNFPTKGHWRAVSRLGDIVAGLEYLSAHYKKWGITSLAVPPLGCGNGQLDWNVVGPTLYRHLKQLDIPVELYAPAGTPREQLTPEFLEGKAAPDDTAKGASTVRITPAAVALVAIISRISREHYHWAIGRTTFQKIAYFATEAGIPTDLEHYRASYGPFAPDLKPLIGQLMNNGLLTETRHGNMFIYQPGRTYRDARERYKPQLKEWADKIEHVADLFLRLPRTLNAELAATVHFAAKNLTKQASNGQIPSEIEVFDAVKQWKVRRRPPLKDHEIALTIRHMNVLGWLDLKGSPDLKVPEPEFETVLA